MGQVYRARDKVLGRDVALKILPEAVAIDRERVARFEREARTLAALNHPNIAQVFDAAGRSASGDGPAFLAMELVAGEDLAARLARGPVPIEEVRRIAHQIALALEAAHESGIVHRDLKPANVKVRDDGTVKVLDFGLAKAIAPSESMSAPPASMSPTVTSPATALGTIIGTAAYMSPEQARGRSVDRRADIWAFGVVVFELLSGTRLFAGETVSDTLAAVLRQEIPWSTLPADTPPYLRRLLARCLDRDPKTRLRDIGEARLALDLDADPAMADAASQSTPRQPKSAARIALAVLPWLLLLVVATTAAALWPRWPSTAPAPATRAVLPHEDAGAIQNHICITSDGRHVVFVALRDGVRRLVVRSLDRLELRAIPGTEGAEAPFLSPDDRWIAFFATNKLKRVPLAGGGVEDLAEVPRLTFPGGTWTARNEIVVPLLPSVALVRIPASGGAPTPIAPESADAGKGIWPLASPDGRFVFFQKGGPLGPEDDYLAVLSLETGEQHETTTAAREPVAVIDGHVLFRRPGGALMAWRFDEATGRFSGEPFQALEPSSSAAVSAAGHAVYLANDERRNLTLRDGARSEHLWTPPWPIVDPRRSPRGDVLTFARGTEREVWVYDAATGAPTRLAEQAGRPSWSPDGKHVVYSRLSPGMQPTREVFWRPVDASAPETRLFGTETMRIAEAQVTPDGQHLLLTASGLWLAPMDNAREPGALVQGEPGIGHARVSADGRWVAYTSTESGGSEVYVRPFPGPGGRVTISSGGGTHPNWAADSRALYYRQGESFVRAALQFSPTPRVVTRTTVLTGDFHRSGAGTYDVMPDGRLLVQEPLPGSIRMVLVLNWIEEFRARTR